MDYLAFEDSGSTDEIALNGRVVEERGDRGP
jgi:hypothetical protein